MSLLSCEQARDLAPGFVMNALDPGEMHDVRDHIAACPEPHPEMAELGSVVPYFAESVEPIEPPAELRGRILGAIEAELRHGRRTDAAADRLISSLGAGSARPSPGVGSAAEHASAAERAERAERAEPAQPIASPVRTAAAATPGTLIDLSAERARRRSPLRWIAAAAAVVLIGVLGVWNIGLSQQLSTAQARQAAVDQVLAIARQPGGQTAILAGASTGGPNGLAALAPDGSFAVALNGLASTSGTQVYEAWVLGASGTPVPIGSFAVGSNGVGGLTAGQAPSGTHLTVGITREPQAGATTPTLPMVVSGVTAQGS